MMCAQPGPEASPATLWLGLLEEEAMGEGLTFSPAWILKDTPRTASGSSGRCLSPKSRNSIWPPRGQGARAAQAGSVQGASLGVRA